MDTTAEPARLDASQQRVVGLASTASGVVIGGPGTGKTTALVARAAALLERLPPSAVLVLTPTRQTATALRDRVAVRAGVATSGPLARSMAAFAFDVVRAHAAAEGEAAPRLLTGSAQDALLAGLLASDEDDERIGVGRWPPAIGAQLRRSRAFRAELRDLFAICAEEGIGPRELARLGTVAARPAWTAAASFLADSHDLRDVVGDVGRDAAELLVEAAARIDAAGASEPPGAAAGVQVVLVDDAQELTAAGVGLLEALRRRGVAVLAFGDPDISSGAFRGATPARFAHLCDLLGDVLVLDIPHRQVPNLTRLTRTVTAMIGAAGRVEHRRAPDALADAAPGPGDDAVRVRRSPSPYEETDLIARTLRGWHVVDGIPWGRMAVIAHDGRQIGELSGELAAREVPTRSGAATRVLGAEPAVRGILGLVRLALVPVPDRDPDDIAAALLTPFGGLDAVGLRRLRARLRHLELADGGTRPARELLAEAMASPSELVLIDTPEARVAERMAETLSLLAVEAAAQSTPHELLWTAWTRARDRSGRRLADAWRDASRGGGLPAADADRSLDALVALFDAAKRDAERAVPLSADAFVTRVLGADVADDVLIAAARPDSVALLTPAGALGAEYDAVIVAGVQDGVWPNVRLRGGALDSWRLADDIARWRAGEAIDAPTDRRRGVLHDELRLFVRAVSRARRHVLITAVEDEDLGPSPFFGFLPDAPEEDAGPASGHPLTLRGLVAQHRRTLTERTAPDAREHAAGQLALLAAAGVPGAAPEEWFGLRPVTTDAPLRDPARGPVHVSPSRLDGFAECGVDWAVKALGGETRSWSAGVGTILHAALEEVPSGDIDALSAVVAARWGELDFEAPWLAEKERAWADLLVERLHLYLRRFQAEGGEALGAETPFGIAVPLDGDPRIVDEADASGPLALLAGTLDRIEVYPPGRGLQLPAADDDPPPDARRRAVVVDLKTGRSQPRYTDAHVVDDAQLMAYQLAVVAGRIPGVDPADNAGARLLVLSRTLKDGAYRIAHQAPLDDAARDAFLARIAETARAMVSDSFDARIDQHCTDSQASRFAVCPIHTVKAVSAS